MGNLCGKEEPQDPHPGRAVGSAPAAQRTSRLPPKVGGPPRTLGGGGGGGGGNAAPPGDEAPSAAGPDDARRRAAEAAEARARAASKGGKLQNQLSAQKKQSRADALKQASEQERRARDADDAAHARNWD